MTITRLVRGVRNAQKIAIYIDSKYTFSVLENIIIDENLYIGKEISQEDLDQLQEVSRNKELMNKVIRLITIRPRSEKEIHQYLTKSTDTQESQKIIDQLKKEGQINDEEFSKWWIDQRITFRNKSVTEIKSELLNKGIKIEVIENYISGYGVEESEVNSIKELANKKKKLLEHKKLSTEQLNEKVQQYLLRKGFRWEMIRNALEDE